MKKALKSIITIVIAIVILFALPGCWIFDDEIVNWLDESGSYERSNVKLYYQYDDENPLEDEHITLGEYLKMICDYSGFKPRKSESYADVAFSYGWVKICPEDLNIGVTRYGASVLLLESLGIIPNFWLESPFDDTDSSVATIMHELGIDVGYKQNGSLVFSAAEPLTYEQANKILKNTAKYFKEQFRKTDFRYLEKQMPRPSEVGVLEVDYYSKIFKYMFLNDLESFDIYYKGVDRDFFIDNEEVDRIELEAYYSARDGEIAEIGCYYDYSINMTRDDNDDGNNTIIRITLKGDNNDKKLAKKYKYEFIMALEEIMEIIVNDGAFKMNWSEYRKARYIYEWCAINYEYDNNLEPLSYTGHNMLFNRTAVCMGYVAVFNSLCKMLGIEVEGVSGIAEQYGVVENHIWSHAKLDGKWVYIDPTWGDDGDICDFDYFAISRKQIEKTHTFTAMPQVLD